MKAVQLALKDVTISGKPSSVVAKLKAEASKDTAKLNTYTINLSKKGKLTPAECLELINLLYTIRTENLSIKNIDLRKTTINGTAIRALEVFLFGGEIGKGSEHQTIPAYDKITGVIIGAVIPKTQNTFNKSEIKPEVIEIVEFKTLDTPTADTNAFFKSEDAQDTQTTRTFRASSIADLRNKFQELKSMQELDIEQFNDEAEENNNRSEYRADSIVGLKDEFSSLMDDLRNSNQPTKIPVQEKKNYRADGIVGLKDEFSSLMDDLRNSNQPTKIPVQEKKNYRADSVVGLKDEFKSLMDDLKNPNQQTTTPPVTNVVTNENTSTDEDFKPGPSTAPTFTKGSQSSS